MRTVRAFIALPLEEELCREIGAFLVRWRKKAPDLKWVDPSLLHVTLRFLGEVDVGLLAPLDRALREVARGTKPFHVSLGRVGAFPVLSRPRVFWLGLEPRDELAALAARVDRQVEAAGLGRRAEPFSPHLTVARARSGPGVQVDPEFVTYWQALAGGEPDGGETPGGQFTASKIVLYESRLHPNGPEYLPLVEVELR